jgi:hypothetical protein
VKELDPIPIATIVVMVTTKIESRDPANDP